MGSNSKYKLNKIDAIIVISLIIIGGVVLIKSGYVSTSFFEEEEKTKAFKSAIPEPTAI